MKSTWMMENPVCPYCYERIMKSEVKDIEECPHCKKSFIAIEAKQVVFNTYRIPCIDYHEHAFTTGNAYTYKENRWTVWTCRKCLASIILSSPYVSDRVLYPSIEDIKKCSELAYIFIH